MENESIKLLLVEDSLAEARLVRISLSDLLEPQFSIAHVQSLSEAFECISNTAFDVILLDLNLPDSAGLETLNCVNERVTDVAIVVLTYLDDPQIANEVVRKGAQYLVKGEVQSNLMARLVRYAVERQKITAALNESKQQLQKALAELAETQKHALQQEKLRAMGQMASGIAHDFNNTLAPILGVSEVLTNFPEMAEDRQRLRYYLDLLSTAAQDAKAVVKRLREFYRNHPDNPFRPVDLNRIVHQAIELTQPKWKDEALGRGVTIHVNTELQELSAVIGSDSELREAIINLILNAVDAMDKDGTITFRSYATPQHIVLEIEDTGMGMSEDVRQRCFDIFFTTKDDQGTGLGLSMVLGTVERHSGSIDLKSEPGAGTVFFIRLPVPTNHSREVDKRTGSIALPPLHVLVAEDEAPILELIATYLTCDGHTVETAVDGKEALRKFRSGHFDVVITDKAMPRMNGDELAIAIKTLCPHQPIIMTTGFDDVILNAASLPVGVDVVLSKPAKLNEFREALSAISRNRSYKRQRTASSSEKQR